MEHRRRKFQLPLFNMLSKDQLKAIHLPRDERHLIIGGPGTGKSVVALLRVLEHHDTNSRDYRFLVYNRLLLAASRQLTDNRVSGSTWISWYKEIFSTMAGRPVNLVEGKGWAIDWKDVETWLAGLGQETLNPPVRYLVIDEGQDMPSAFYSTLANMGLENFYVVADQNQQIGEDNSSRKDLEDSLVIDTDQVIELTYNFRNPYPVARLAREFYTGDPASPPPELPPVSGESVNTPMLVEYVESGHEPGFCFQKLIKRLLIMSDNWPNKLIAVITRSKSTRQRYYQCLLDMVDHMKSKLAHPPLIKIYDTDGGSREEHSFDQGGIFVLTAKSCKGLEFDTVFIADIHEYPYYPNIEETQKKLFYVMVARAREKVFLLKQKGPCPIDAMLPGDPSVLTRWPRDKERIKHERD